MYSWYYVSTNYINIYFPIGLTNDTLFILATCTPSSVKLFFVGYINFFVYFCQNNYRSLNVQELHDNRIIVTQSNGACVCEIVI